MVARLLCVSNWLRIGRRGCTYSLRQCSWLEPQHRHVCEAFSILVHLVSKQLLFFITLAILIAVPPRILIMSRSNRMQQPSKMGSTTLAHAQPITSKIKNNAAKRALMSKAFDIRLHQLVLDLISKMEENEQKLHRMMKESHERLCKSRAKVTKEVIDIAILQGEDLTTASLPRKSSPTSLSRPSKGIWILFKN